MGGLSTLLRTFFGRSGDGMLARLVGPATLAAIIGLVRREGGLPALLDRFRSSGLAEKASSWVDIGPNTPLNGDEVERALGPDEIDRVADEIDASHDEAREQLAAGLPEVVNHLTPKGEVPDEATVDRMIDRLRRYVPD